MCNPSLLYPIIYGKAHIILLLMLSNYINNTVANICATPVSIPPIYDYKIVAGSSPIPVDIKVSVK